MLAVDITTFTKLDRILLSKWNLKAFHVIFEQIYVYSKSQKKYAITEKEKTHVSFN